MSSPSAIQSRLPRHLDFELLAECPVTPVRAAILHTDHRDIPTPVLMPVGTQATVKGLTQRDLREELGAPSVAQASP